ncbi:hypothetical protein [Emticicia sp. 21SJ11W-3]|nr:hypothetical protein [Emticicia sp. 21SJ11W-3]UTA68755.1 hypothetical protein MB380_02875 [Emticicia sp. 21SJ11W-3]
MEATKHKNEEQNPQKQPQKAWVKPEMKILDVDGGPNPLNIEVNGYVHPS